MNQLSSAVWEVGRSPKASSITSVPLGRETVAILRLAGMPASESAMHCDSDNSNRPRTASLIRWRGDRSQLQAAQEDADV